MNGAQFGWCSLRLLQILPPVPTTIADIWFGFASDMPICFKTDGIFILQLAGRAALLGLLLLALAGCATIPEQSSARQVVATGQPGDAELPRWWYVRFRLRRGDAGEVDSFLDPLIADQVLAPVIARNETDITLWRFHRRWPDDPTGHQFSFIFFAPPPIACVVTGQIKQSPVLEQLRSEGRLLEFRIDKAGPDRGTDPAATSDTSWPPEIQREWPKFIMGASRMWLGLIRAEAAKNSGMDLYSRYRAVEGSLDALWFSEANHAFFHHLSALFGYKPTQVIRREVMTF